jgi:hypothetical protein
MEPDRRNPWAYLYEREPGTVRLGFKGVLLEADPWIMALYPDCHFPRRAGIRVLGCFPLGLHPLSCPVTIAEQLRNLQVRSQRPRSSRNHPT